MNYGELRVLTPDGQTRVYPLDTPAAVIGRSAENSVVIDDPSVARRHARLVIDSGNPYIEDLGSEGGTFVAGRRLTSGERALMNEGTAVLVGDVSLTFRAPAAEPPRGRSTAAAAFAADRMPASQPLVVSIEGPTAPVAPGSAGSTTVRIQNRGAVVDEVEISVQDLPPDWIEVSRPLVTLLPGARQEVTIVLRPPRGTAAMAGDHPFAVTVRSREHGSEIRVIGTLAVPTSSGFSIQLQPVRSQRRFDVRLLNTGNAPVSVALAGRDDEDKLNFSFALLNLDLPPGQQREVALNVGLRGAPKFGREQIHPFKVEAQQAGGGANAPKQSADGQLRHNPPLQAWKFPVLAIVAVAALVGVVVGYTKNCESQGWPGCGGAADGKLSAAAVAATAAAATTAAGGAGQSVVAGGQTATALTQPPAGASTTAGGAGAGSVTAVPTTPSPPGTTATVPSGSTTSVSTSSTTVTAVATTPAPTTVTPVKKPTFTKAEPVLKRGADYTATITTSKGDFVIDFETATAGATVNSFIFLAERGFFDDLPFSVTRGVVAQNGDPTGDGKGGPGYTTAYETSGLTNKRATVSMIPTETASFLRLRQFGSQFYINLRDNVQFDTGGIAGDIRPPFATVTKGMEIVDALATGDRITKIQVFEKVGTVTPVARPTIGHPIIIVTPAPSN